MKEKVSAEDRVREICRKTRKKDSTEEKVRTGSESLPLGRLQTRPSSVSWVTTRPALSESLPTTKASGSARRRSAAWTRAVSSVGEKGLTM